MAVTFSMLTLAPAAVVLATAVGFGWHLRMYRLGEASRGWRRIRGTILELWHDESSAYDEDEPDRVHFSAHMTYAYEVAGKRYRAKRFTYRPTRGLDQKVAYALLRGLRRGQPVDVYYDPAKPGRAVVLAGTDSGNLRYLALWGIGLLMSLGWLLASMT